MAPLVSAVSALKGKPIPPGEVEKVGQALGRLIDGSWEEVAQLVAANVGMRL